MKWKVVILNISKTVSISLVIAMWLIKFYRWLVTFKNLEKRIKTEICIQARIQNFTQGYARFCKGKIIQKNGKKGNVLENSANLIFLVFILIYLRKREKLGCFLNLISITLRKIWLLFSQVAASHSPWETQGGAAGKVQQPPLYPPTTRFNARLWLLRYIDLEKSLWK